VKSANFLFALNIQKKLRNLMKIGDIGLGAGSRRLYEYLTKHLGQSDFSAITFHYLQPQGNCIKILDL